jgi:hypothetical protein
MRATSSDGTSAAAGTPLDTAILSPERVIRGKIEVDWAKNGFSGSTYFGQVPAFDDTFPGASLDPRWALAGAGATFDSVNHQVVLPNIIGTNTGSGSPQSTTGGTSLSLVNYCNFYGATLRFKFTQPTLTGTTRRMDIYIIDVDTGDYWYFRNDSGGLYLQTYNYSTVSPQSKVATWQYGNTSFVAKQIDLSFADNCNPTTVVTPVSGLAFTASPFSGQFPTPPPRLNKCKIVVTAYTTSSEAAANTTIQEVMYLGAANTDNVSREADSLEVDRSLQGVLPEQVSIIEGSSTAQTSVNLVSGETADERKTAAWKFSPFNQNSPLYSSPVLNVPVRASIEIETPAGSKTFQKMVGSVSELDVDVNSGNAPLTAFDYRSQLAGSVQLPAIDGDAFGLNATALIDYALAQNGVNWGAPLQTGAQLWAPMHGTAFPMVSGNRAAVKGRLLLNGEALPNSWSANWSNVSTVHPFFTWGPFGNTKALALGKGAAISSYYPSSVTQARFYAHFTPYTNGTNDMFSQGGAKGVINLWVKADAFASPTDDLVNVRLDGPWIGANVQAFFYLWINSSRQIGVIFQGPTGGAVSYSPFGTLPSDGAWHNIGMSWDGTDISGTNFKIYAGMDGSTATANIPWIQSLMPVHDVWQPTSNFFSYLPIAEIQAYPVTGIQTDAGYTNANKYIQTANLDYSTLELKSNRDTTIRDAWGLINEIGDTEFAARYFDEDGIYQYHTRNRLASTASQTVQRTLDGKTAIIDLKLSSGVDKVRNVVTANVEPVQISRNSVVFTSTDTFVLPPLQKTRITLQFQNPVVSLWYIQYGTAFTPVLPDNAFPWPDTNASVSGYGVPHGMVCVRTAQSGGSITGIPYPTVVVSDANSITLEFNNASTQTLYIVNDGQVANLGGVTYSGFGSTGAQVMQYWGNPSIMLVGDMLIPQSNVPVTYTHSYSVSQYGPQALALNDSQWLQDTGTAYGLAASVAGTLGQPVPVAAASIVGDPRLQLADRVKLQAGDFDGNVDNPVLNSEFWLEGLTDTISANDGYKQEITLRLASKVMKFSNLPTDTQYGFFDRSNTNKWDRYTWG